MTYWACCVVEEDLLSKKHVKIDKNKTFIKKRIVL